MKFWAWILCGALLFGMGAPEIRLEQRKAEALLYVRPVQGELQVETDLGDRGSGKDLQEAIRDLQEKTAGIVILETLQYLVIDRNALGMIGEAGKSLHPGTLVCASEGEINPQAAGRFLKAHGKGNTLLECRQGTGGIPILQKKEGTVQWKRAD